MKDFIIIPTYNESKNITVLVRKVFGLYPEINILVVDDNSPDGTASEVRQLQSEFPHLHLRERSGKLGLASAYLETFTYLLNTEPDIRAIITMDADLSHDPIVIGEMLQKIETHDLVLGSRYVSGGGIENWQLWRLLLSKGGNLYARIISGIPIHDLTTGYQCFRADLLRHPWFSHINAAGFAFLMELKMIAYASGARIHETPIHFKNRVDGVSKISKHIIYEGLIVPWILRVQIFKLRQKQEKSKRT